MLQLKTTPNFSAVTQQKFNFLHANLQIWATPQTVVLCRFLFLGCMKLKVAANHSVSMGTRTGESLKDQNISH